MQDTPDPKWSWRYDAKCRGEDTELFFPPRNKDLYKPIADQAKAICNGKDGKPPCKVRFECLMEAIETDETHGIWGGMSHRERNALTRKLDKQAMSMDEFWKTGGPG
jgi:WhiB family redox-sensing transcriptional regulator